jgi:DNA-binding IclR family transcriptional regulator
MTDDIGQKSPPLVGSIVAAAGILRLLAQEIEPLGVNAIARRKGLSPSSCFNILKTLVAEGFADFDAVSKTYSLGVTPVFLARRALNSEQALRVATQHLQSMAADYRCVSSLWKIVPGDRLMLLGLFDSRSVINIHIEVGQRLPSLVGAMGRCVAASGTLDRPGLKAAFEKLSWQRRPAFENYLADVELARSRGWAVDVDNFAQGVTTVAASIADRNGTAQYCISNILFSGQAEVTEIDKIGAEVARVSRHVAAELYP